MPKLFDLVKVNTTTTGTGTITFGAAVGDDFFTPAEVGVGDGDVVRYVLIDGSDIELGVGTVGGSVTTMTRTVKQSKIGGVAGTSKLDLGGTAYLALTASADDILNLDDADAARVVLSAFGVVHIQKFTSSGTYTPDPSLIYAVIECQGGGGGGGGIPSSTSGYTGSAGGGGAGCYARLVVSAADIGVSQTVTIGAAGSGGAAGNNGGTNGGTSSVGTLCSAGGGMGGSTATANNRGGPGSGSNVGTGDIVIAGQTGAGGGYITSTIGNGIGVNIAGAGGDSFFGRGAPAGYGAGSAGTGYGSGGGGGGAFNGASAAAGGNGAQGVALITEFCGK